VFGDRYALLILALIRFSLALELKTRKI